MNSAEVFLPVPVGPEDPYWQIGPHGTQLPLADGRTLAAENRFSVELQPPFPPGGLVRLQDWLPDMSQLDFFKTLVQLLGLTVQSDPYRDHLYLSTGGRVLTNTALAKEWTAKRDAAPTQPGLPARATTFRLGDYGQRNVLRYTADDTEPRPKVAANVPLPLYLGDGELLVNDANLPTDYELGELPFVASFESRRLAGLLRILCYEATEDSTAATPKYNDIEPEPRLTLRPEGTLPLAGELITVAARPITGGVPAVEEQTQPYTTTLSYFADQLRPFDLDAQRTLLPQFWPDTAATLAEARALTEQYRLTPQDIAQLDFSVPIWDAGLGDFFLVSAVKEYDPATPTVVELVRLNAAHLPPPILGTGFEFYALEFQGYEFY